MYINVTCVLPSYPKGKNIAMPTAQLKLKFACLLIDSTNLHKKSKKHKN